MKLRFLVISCFSLLAGCSFGVKMDQKETFEPRIRPQTVFVVPFTTIMVPPEVNEGLFDRFVDNLNADERQTELDFIILKQGLDAIDPEWLSKRDYVTGEIFAYVEDIGTTTASIRAKSRISLYQAKQVTPTLQLDYPVEVFYEKDYTSLEDARRKLTAKISDSMAKTLVEALAGQ